MAPTTNKTYTATFRTLYYLTMTHGTGGTVSPGSGWKNSGTTVSTSATPTNNTQVSYSFSAWTGTGNGSYSGTNNPASITMNGPITENATFIQNPVQVTVQTNPAGRSFSVDGTTYTSVQTFSWDLGASHTIATTSPQSGGTGVRYVWGNWSGGGAISHAVTPTTNKVYTANFSTQYYLTMSHNTGGTVSPASGWRGRGTAVSITARPTRVTASPTGLGAEQAFTPGRIIPRQSQWAAPSRRQRASLIIDADLRHKWRQISHDFYERARENSSCACNPPSELNQVWNTGWMGKEVRRQLQHVGLLAFDVEKDIHWSREKGCAVYRLLLGAKAAECRRQRRHAR